MYPLILVKVFLNKKKIEETVFSENFLKTFKTKEKAIEYIKKSLIEDGMDPQIEIAY